VTVGRRTALKALGLPALLAATGCVGQSNGTVRVAVVWSGNELAAFRSVLAEFSRRRKWDVQVLTVGDNIGAVMESQVGRRTRPDVVLLPRSGLAHRYQDRLATVAGVPLEAFPPAWRGLVTRSGGGSGGAGDLGIWFKTAHKSLVWYRRDVFAQAGVEPPTDMAGWIAVNRRLAQRGVPPLAIGAADGWVLTDWFENLLLGRDREAYLGLAAEHDPRRWRAEPVRRALTDLALLWTPADRMLPGGASRALLMQFQDSIVDVFARRRAAMVAAADFASPVIAEFAAGRAGDVGLFRFPGVGGGPPPLVVGGDLAVLLAPPSAGGTALMQWLAGPDAARIWAGKGGYISLRDDVGSAAYGPWYRTYYTDDLLAEVRRNAGRSPVFDLSDQLTGRLGGGDGLGAWRILQDFFAALGAGTVVDVAVSQAVDAFTRAAENRRGSG
jgi:alpha-glucoside transport system substrate-binding protein